MLQQLSFIMENISFCPAVKVTGLKPVSLVTHQVKCNTLINLLFCLLSGCVVYVRDMHKKEAMLRNGNVKTLLFSILSNLQFLYTV